ncbi:hypothetical protein [Rhizobium sp. SSA_523]|uniref:hypothetical protein n=1 Tax=Rhizobium sp. SSA_523 TaxID=2952477 RepID=UPI0020919986|nr:hypothetical protein [Rhizobium sp. SSA_523]MCO5730352.1 hypothetical protein [Rhizobium sp. SSA_523]WKC25399.1 hypothetical protein QTJ18_15640 [Rhizobium sp. SSA_523]
MKCELTMTELASDPLIAMVMRADGVDHEALADLMSRTARLQVEHLQQQISQARADDFYARLDGDKAMGRGKPAIHIARR